MIGLELAGLHSEAVDYPKTGEVVDWDRKKCMPKQWPHFMERDPRKSYVSRQVLGRLYDNVTNDKITFEPDLDHAFDKRVLHRYDLQPEPLAKAKRIKEQHDRAVRRILAQLNLGTEFELWTGYAMSKPTVGTAYKRQEVLAQEFETLKLRFRSLCEEAAGGSAPEEIDPFVAAMYKVTEEEYTQGLQQVENESSEEDDYDMESRPPVSRQMPLISFPWIFPEVMARIAVGDEWVKKKPWYAARARGPSASPPSQEKFVPPHKRRSPQGSQ